MKLLWVKTGTDILVGEVPDRSIGIPPALDNPMAMQYVNMPQPSKVIANGKQPDMVTGFRFVVIPCSQIRVDRVDYCGEVKKHDPVFVTYYKVLEAQKKQDDDPLMVTQ